MFESQTMVGYLLELILRSQLRSNIEPTEILRHPLPRHNKRASKLLWENDTNDQTFENLPARRSCYSTSYTKKDTHFPLTEGFCLRYCVCPKVAIKSESELACLFGFTMDTPVTMSLKSRWDTQTWWEMLFSRSENGQEAVHVNWKLLWVSK